MKEGGSCGFIGLVAVVHLRSSDDPVRRGRPRPRPCRLRHQAPVAADGAIAANVRFGWGTADEAYGGNGRLRRFLDQPQINYVLAVSCTHQVTTGVGQLRADVLAQTLPGLA